MIDSDKVKSIVENRFLHFYDLCYAPGKHYYEVSRNQRDHLVACMEDDAFREAIADAVTVCLIICSGGEERLLLAREYRYPVGRFLISPPAGLVDEKGTDVHAALIAAAKREVKEETGIEINDNDSVFVVNERLFSSPGMTDESNALICMIVSREHPEQLIRQDLAEGTELFDGYTLISRTEAEKILTEGKDAYGFSYSVYTWAVLMFFVSDRWRKLK